jgi:hypothetical protein
MVASGESLGEGIASHGLDADLLIDEMNKLIEETK